LVVVCNDHAQGSFLLAVDRKTGREVWKVSREGKRACYATPCVYRAAGRSDELIFSHCFEGITGVDPASGEQKWMIDVFGTHPQRAVGSPIVYDDLVIANSGALGGEKNVVAVRPWGDGAGVQVEEVYRVTKNAPHVPTTVAYADLLFLWSDTGIVTCVRARTGQVVWRNRVGGNYFSSPVCIDGKLYGVELSGEVVVIRAADQFELLGRNPLGRPSRATPAVSGGVMFLRSYSHLCSLGARK
jgi:outer membrane protein assembly factor BamB